MTRIENGIIVHHPGDKVLRQIGDSEDAARAYVESRLREHVVAAMAQDFEVVRVSDRQLAMAWLERLERRDALRRVGNPAAPVSEPINPSIPLPAAIEEARNKLRVMPRAYAAG